MDAPNFEFSERFVDGYEVFTVPGPDMLRDTLIPLLPIDPHREGGIDLLEKRFNDRPSRSSLFRWRVDGYPVDRDGPRVILPTVRRLKRIYTSAPALTRFFQMIQFLGTSITDEGGVDAWRRHRRRSD